MKQAQYHKRDTCRECGGAGRWSDLGLCEDCRVDVERIHAVRGARRLGRQLTKQIIRGVGS